jgi:hypothetical protein
MDQAPEAFLGSNTQLHFYLDFPCGSYIEKIREGVGREQPEPKSEEEYQALEDLIAERYQARLAADFEANTEFHTRPSHLTGREVCGPGGGFDPLILYGLLTAANMTVAAINDWAEMATKVRRALAWLKRKAHGESPAISNGVALILGAQALREHTGHGDLSVAFVCELNHYPPCGEDYTPVWNVDYLVGARSKRWLYMCRVSDKGDVAIIGRVRLGDAT